MLRINELLGKGLEITGTYENVAKVITDVDKFEGIETFTNSKTVTATIDLDKFEERHVFDLRNLFFVTKYNFSIKLDSNKIMNEDGSIIDAREFFTFEPKEDKRKSKISKSDIVKLRYYNNGVAIYALNGLFPKEIKSDIGFVKDVDDKGIASVVVDSKTYKLPTICCIKINIFDASFKKIVAFMTVNNRQPKIDGKMLYLSVSDDGKMVQYIAEDRLDRFEGKFWDADLRKRFATEKKIRKVLKPMFDCNDDLLENAILISGKNTLEVELLKGDEILEVFLSDKCHHNGTIGNSCMRDRDENIFKIYTDSAKCAIARDGDGKIILRAIVWELINNKTGRKVKFMDRIYSSSTAMETLFVAWANENNYYHLKQQTYSSHEIISPKGLEDTVRNYYAVVKKAHYEQYPFLDTLRYKVGKTISCCGTICQSTSGGSSRA